MNQIAREQSQEYDIITQTFAKGQEVAVDARCNGWTAINTGDVLVVVNNIPLKPYPPGHPELTGAAVAIPGTKWEIFTGRIWIVFPMSSANPQVVIIQKYYK